MSIYDLRNVNKVIRNQQEYSRVYAGNQLLWQKPEPEPVGQNLIISSDVTPGVFLNSNGSLQNTRGHFITGFIEVKANEVYTISMLLQRNGYSRVAYYDLDKNFIKRGLFRNQEVTQIKPEQDGFIRWSPDVDRETGYGPGYKIEKGDTPTEWTPAPEDITPDTRYMHN